MSIYHYHAKKEDEDERYLSVSGFRPPPESRRWAYKKGKLMSYDLMVFDPNIPPRDREGFMVWYKDQTAWSEDHSYDDPKNTSPILQTWLNEFMKEFPAMNGPCAASEDIIDDPHVTDHCIGRHVVYSAFAWSIAEKAYKAMRESAIRHGLGFFNVSSDEGEILFPDMEI